MRGEVLHLPFLLILLWLAGPMRQAGREAEKRDISFEAAGGSQRSYTDKPLASTSSVVEKVAQITTQRIWIPRGKDLFTLACRWASFIS